MYTTAELFIMAFSPPYGDGTDVLTAYASDKGFSPPYGDGTCTPHCINFVNEFSPPYGDGTEFMMKKACDNKFSPPYGDGTLNISQKIVKWKS